MSDLRTLRRVKYPSWVDGGAELIRNDDPEEGFGSEQVNVVKELESEAYEEFLAVWRGALFRFRYITKSRAYGPHWEIVAINGEDMAKKIG